MLCILSLNHGGSRIYWRHLLQKWRKHHGHSHPSLKHLCQDLTTASHRGDLMETIFINTNLERVININYRIYIEHHLAWWLKSERYKFDMWHIHLPMKKIKLLKHQNLPWWNLKNQALFAVKGRGRGGDKLGLPFQYKVGKKILLLRISGVKKEVQSLSLQIHVINFRI